MDRVWKATRILSDAEKYALLRTTILENPWIPHDPHPPQAAFLLTQNREVLYGGAAGGGKSDALLMAAAQYVEVPGYAAMLFRKTIPDLTLKGALIPRSHDWWDGTAAVWSQREKTWTFPSGATISFGYMEHPGDELRYKGAEFQFCGFDELTSLFEVSYRYMHSRTRRLIGSNVPIRMRSASNPGDKGHEWVKRRFLLEGTKYGRLFIPARLEDNPSLDAEEYEESLDELDPITRAQLRAGDWDIRTDGKKFKKSWFPTVPVAPTQAYRLRWWDFAATEPKKGTDPDWTAGARVAMTREGIWYIEDIARFRGTPEAVERFVKATTRRDHAGGTQVPVWLEQEPGASGKIASDHYIRNILRGYAVRVERPTGNKEVRANPVSSQAEAGNVFLVEGDWNGAWLDEAVSFPVGEHDDQVDAVSGAFGKLAQGRPSRSVVGGNRRAIPVRAITGIPGAPLLPVGGSRIISYPGTPTRFR